MKKAFLLAGFASVVMMSASAQTKKKNPPPPPKAPVEITNEVPPPPPPAPPPPPPPMRTSISEKEIVNLPADYQDFLKRNPSVGSVNWHEDSVFIALRNGNIERYQLDEEGIRHVEAKYGTLPTAPPPPPEPPVPPKAPKAPSVPKPKQ